MGKKILKLFSGVMLFLVLSKITGFLRESLIASRYGTGFISDVYVFQDGFINAIYTVCAGAIGVTFVPKFLSFERKERDYFASNYLNILIFIMVIIMVVCIVFTPQITRIVVPGFYEQYDTGTINSLYILTRINLLSLILVLIENFCVVVLQANKYFVFASIEGLILNGVLIIYLLFFYQYELFGLIVFKLSGYLLNIIIFFTIIIKNNLYRYKRVFNPRSPAIREVFSLALPSVLVNIVSQFDYIIDRSMASSFSSGSMTLLNYANTIASLLYSVVGMSLNSMAYTSLCENQNHEEKVRQTFSEYNSVLMRLLIPCCIVLFICCREATSIVYEHGAVKSSDIDIAAKILMIYIFSNFALCIRDLNNRLLYLKKKTSFAAKINVLGFICNIILNIVLSKVIGIYGLAIATTITSTITCLITYASTSKYRDKNSVGETSITIVKLLSSILIAAVLHSRWSIDGLIGKLFQIALLLIVCIAIFNIEDIIKLIRRKV